MRAFYSDFVWRKSEKNTIYLTFDDGPIPEITEFVLETLQRFDAKATFFCIGDNIQKNDWVFDKIIEQKHSVGNHTFNHLKGWETDDDLYLENTQKCQLVLEKQDTRVKKQEAQKLLFRPPYGRIKKSQAKVLLPDYQIVMWDVLSGDFSMDISPEKCLRKTIQYTEGGSIVVFHDSIKASKNMMFALPKFLEHFAEKGYQFKGL
ncbi:MAG: polysaccharide deacetylase family protein [Spirosomaceae bacterium]|jgi:peptidoglycan/xylan/chitin deacetylase (PgdA/CDA1 family)|nr:polysaccharide deacetylase family protein [Spirosomataceae bacterium]